MVILHIFHCAYAKRTYFYFCLKYEITIVFLNRFHIKREKFGDSAINKGYIAYFSLPLPD